MPMNADDGTVGSSFEGTPFYFSRQDGNGNGRRERTVGSGLVRFWFRITFQKDYSKQSQSSQITKRHVSTKELKLYRVDPEHCSSDLIPKRDEYHFKGNFNLSWQVAAVFIMSSPTRTSQLPSNYTVYAEQYLHSLELRHHALLHAHCPQLLTANKSSSSLSRCTFK